MTLLRLHKLSATYGQRQVLNDISAHIEPGEIVALIGANASGKSTLVRTLAGLQRGWRGTMTFPQSPLEARPPIGLAVAPEALPPGLTGLHAMDLVAAALRTIHTDAALDYARAVGLHPLLREPIASYSLGTKQKLAIMLALVGEPKLLLLDESLNGLDLPSVVRTLEYLQERIRLTRQSALLVTHHIDLAQAYVQRVWLLEEGRLGHEWTSDELDQMQRDSALISRQILERLSQRRPTGEAPLVREHT